jgi:hypothetical protein
MAPLRLRGYADYAFQCGDYSRILRRAEWGLSDRFAEPEVAPEDGSGGAPAVCAGTRSETDKILSRLRGRRELPAR